MRVESVDRAPAELVERLLRALPQWFGIESAIVEYVADSHRLPALIAHDHDGAAVGVLLWRRPFCETVDIHLMAVDPARHRRGIGRAMVRALERLATDDGARLVSVKTLGPSHPDEHYRRTRAFYSACGFVPVEELLDLWPDNPCLVMVDLLPDV